MRCLYFKLKDEVFKKCGLFPLSDTAKLEEILKSTVGEHRKLGCKTYPKYVYGDINNVMFYVFFCRVLITTVNVDYSPMELVFYNNFEDGPIGKGTLDAS